MSCTGVTPAVSTGMMLTTGTICFMEIARQESERFKQLLLLILIAGTRAGACGGISSLLPLSVGHSAKTMPLSLSREGHGMGETCVPRLYQHCESNEIRLSSFIIGRQPDFIGLSGYGIGCGLPVFSCGPACEREPVRVHTRAVNSRSRLSIL